MEYRTKKDHALTLIRDLIIAGKLNSGERLDRGDLVRSL